MPSGKEGAYHERLFRVFDKDLKSRFAKYERIQQIKDFDERRRAEGQFLEAQKKVLEKFISYEHDVRKKIEADLKLEKADVTGWRRRWQFNRLRKRHLRKFNSLLKLSKALLNLINTPGLSAGQVDKFLRKFRKHLSGVPVDIVPNSLQNELGSTKLKVSLAFVVLLFLSIASREVHAQCGSNLADNMSYSDWAAGAHRSYGFHTMLDRIIRYDSKLPGIRYRGFEDNRYGNPDANILDVTGGFDKLIPKGMMDRMGGINSMEIAALNKGESQIKIVVSGRMVLDVFYHQDSPVRTGVNSYNFSDSELTDLYNKVLNAIDHAVNSN